MEHFATYTNKHGQKASVIVIELFHRTFMKRSVSRVMFINGDPGQEYQVFTDNLSNVKRKKG